MAPNLDIGLPTPMRGPHDGQVVSAAKRVQASWQRSEDYGVSAETVDPVWAGSVATDSLFFQCGQDVLSGLHGILANEPVSLMLTDADGLVLNRFSGDTSLLRALDKVHLAPGFAFSERVAGTNGMGLALADRTASLVRAEEHYTASLRTYTCAAVPVLDLRSGRLEGSVNITTWSRSSPELLLALAQSAASNTSALMLARSQGRTVKPEARGGVFRVQRGGLEPGSGTLRDLSSMWTGALIQAVHALAAGRVLAAVGEHGTGRATLLGQALRQVHPTSRILCAAAPAPEDVDAWLSLWVPELSKPETAVIVENVDRLPAWAAQELQAHALGALQSRPVSTAGTPPVLVWAVTAEEFDAIPQPLAALVETVVPVPALRERGGADILSLARYAARQTRLREVDFTPAAERVLTAYDWPDNIDELFRIVHTAALRTDTIDVRHLPSALIGPRGRHLTRMESIERDEIIRCLLRPGITVGAAAAELGLSRATIYRRMARLEIVSPK
ncbi:helix-turn-helix domain-containing protein [Cryobacterium tagatosivorans]|uniref:Fis family transcriptional regulator n=1 Tax=Cryobacterium tagatosivorans TaxID=1259199 RepID=A0A4R8UH51_9MICO|nr:helix-turn-helix domain-containing protein [Cryobacterium tagatosivorans]TFB53608.1 Fis family transcriptional regulator [Cryobacterium tagatosivorans]